MKRGFVGSAIVLAVCACAADRTGFDDSPPAGPTLGTDAATPETDAKPPCLSETLAAEPVPLAMILVMDRSGSMSSPSGNTKWDQARNAMIGFADTPGASGTKLGLTVFPPDPEETSATPPRTRRSSPSRRSPPTDR